MNIHIKESDTGARVMPSTEIVGHVLKRAGGMPGAIVVKNPDIPIFIQQGSREIKREWLVQAFGDEGSTSYHSFLRLSRSVDATHRLSDEQRNRLDALSKEWKKGWTKYCRFKDLPEDIRESLRLERPRLLESEARMLGDDFGIDMAKHPRGVYQREGGYAVSWDMDSASLKGRRLFFDEIGFPQNRKQDVLRRALRIKEEDTRLR